jgi:MFS family permease
MLYKTRKMKPWVRKGGIYGATFFSCIAFTVFTPFFSKVAVEHGIPPWIIGFIYSSTPLASIIVSSLLPRYLQQIGRTRALLIGVTLIGLGNILISIIGFFSITNAIVLSFLSRIIAGTGSAFDMISAYSTLTSDYPEEISKIIASIEIVSGLGLIAGPFFGSLLFALGGFFYACVFIGLIMWAYTPLLYFIVGPSRPYHLSDDEISISTVALRPVTPT